MQNVLVILLLVLIAIAGESVMRRRFSRSVTWLTVHPSVLLLSYFILDVKVPLTDGKISFPGVLLGILVAGLSYQLLRYLFNDRFRRDLADGYPKIKEGIALVIVLPVVEQIFWGWIVGPVLGVIVTALLFGVKHPISDGNWRRLPALFGFWVGISMIIGVNPFVAIPVHCLMNGVAFAKTIYNKKDEF